MTRKSHLLIKIIDNVGAFIFHVTLVLDNIFEFFLLRCQVLFKTIDFCVSFFFFLINSTSHCLYLNGIPIECGKYGVLGIIIYTILRF